MKTVPPNPILVHTTRSGLVETVHRGSYCICDASGKIMHSAGDLSKKVFPRSALKFFQILPLLESGAAQHFGLTAAEIAVICASHNAEPEHIATVESILSKIGLDKSALLCGTHLPIDQSAAIAHLKTGQDLNALHNNCSGKHAGFLACCQFLGYELGNYLDPEHPLQKEVKRRISNLCLLDEELMYCGVDGCSAPNYAMPIDKLATGFAGLAKAFQNKDSASVTIFESIRNAPYMLAGKGRFCTALASEMGGRVIGKVGAAGVYGMSFLKEGLGAVIKMDDGLMGPQYAVAIELIKGIIGESEMAEIRFREESVKSCNGVRLGSLKSISNHNF